MQVFFHAICRVVQGSRGSKLASAIILVEIIMAVSFQRTHKNESSVKRNGDSHVGEEDSGRSGEFEQAEVIHAKGKYSMQKDQLPSSSRFSSSSRSNEVPIAVATAAAESDLEGLLDMIENLRRHSGNMKLIIFDIDLSDLSKTLIADKDQNVQIKKFHFGTCKTCCKALMVCSLLDNLSIIIWADIMNLPSWDLRLVLDEYPVGTSFVGHFSTKMSDLPISSEPFKHGYNLTMVSSKFFIMFPNVRFYYRVLLPWFECSVDQSNPHCAGTTRVRNQINVPRAQFSGIKGTESYHSDGLLTVLLLDYQRLFPDSILIRDAIRAVPPEHGRVAHQTPLLPYVSDDLVLDKTFIAFITRYGPNNQLSMTYESAALALKMNVRVLLPPIAKHHVRSDRPGVPQEKDQIMTADRIFTAHFLYRSALLADPASSWATLLPSVDFIIFEPLAACPSQRNCTIQDLMKSDPIIRRYFHITGLAKEAAATVNVVRCSSIRYVKACLRSSHHLGRNIIAAPNFWKISAATRARGECSAQMPLPRASPFAVQRGMMANTVGTACVALQLRLLDTQLRDGSRFVNNVPEDALADAPAFSVLMRTESPDTAPWRNKTLMGVIAAMRDAVARKGLRLYVLMPFHRTLFDTAARLENVTTARALSVHGLSDLEVLFLEMALAAGCSGGVVLDPSSSLSVTIAAMRGGEGLLDAQLGPLPDSAWCRP